MAEVIGQEPAIDTLSRARNITVFLPSVSYTWNSAIPYSVNDGALWAGRGTSISVEFGAKGQFEHRGRMFVAAFQPEFLYTQNLPFQVVPSNDPGRSFFASPWHGPGASADLPLRFGDRHLLSVGPGGSRIGMQGKRLSVSLTSAEDWWGPGIRNALLMSNNAGGIPRIEVATSQPLATKIGLVEAKGIIGTLTESRFFDRSPSNDFRSISAARVELRPAFDTTLTLGFSRAATRLASSPVLDVLTHAGDVIAKWGTIAAAGDTPPSDRLRQSVDQIMALTARWIFPDAGFEVYGEWARMDPLYSVTELLVAGHHTGGYTLGFQWAQQKRSRDYLRLQSEVTYLEQSSVFPDRPPVDFYSGRASAQGYTNRGQIIGASIGPGASSQFIGLDYIAPSWQLGTFGGRIRWENDALYRQLAPNFARHDVTMLGGLRGAIRTQTADFASEFTYGYRYNYLFQNGFAYPGSYGTVDVANFTLTFSATPR